MGIRTALNALQYAYEYGIKHVTAYVLSLENMKSRPAIELDFIMKYFKEECDSVLENKDHVINKLGVKVNFIGRIKELNESLQEKLDLIEKRTANNKSMVLNVAIAYGGQQEIADAVQKIALKVKDGSISPEDLNEEVINNHLYTANQPSPDLIIRTGGERRLSNFLPYQSAYSELLFLDKRWPEMQRKDFIQAFEEFENRKRRFGK